MITSPNHPPLPLTNPQPTPPPLRNVVSWDVQGMHPASSEYWGGGSYKDPVVIEWIKKYNADVVAGKLDKPAKKKSESGAKAKGGVEAKAAKPAASH